MNSITLNRTNAKSNKSKFARGVIISGPEMTFTVEMLPQILAALAETPATLTALVKDLSDNHLRSKHSHDEFSIVENLCHLRDIEIEGYSIRIARILKESGPTLADIDGSRLALERDYNSQSASHALEQFSHARKANVEALRGIGEEQLNREGTLEGVGTVTLQKLLSMMCEHDEDHVADIKVIGRRLCLPNT